MIIKRVNTEIFINELETRGSYPSIFECSDNERYIVKHSQQNSNFKHLINEFIAVKLAKIINIPVADFAIVEIKNNIIPNDFTFACGKPSGLGFGSNFLKGNLKIISNIDTIIDLTKKNDDFLVDLINICAFDIWLRNVDRSINNPNLMVQEQGKRLKLYAIDHACIFSDLNFLYLEREIDEPPTVGENLVDKELFNYLFYKLGLFFNTTIDDICQKIAAINENSISEIIKNVPLEWKLGNEAKEEIFNFINKRKNNVENHFNILLKEIGL